MQNQNKPTTASEAMTFWASKAIEFDQLVNDLADLLPDIDADGGVPMTDSSLEEIEKAFANARLAADTVLGAYTRHTFKERAAAQQNGQQQPYAARW